MKIKCKNVRTGQIVEKTYRASEKVTQAIVEKKSMQYLYREGDSYVFMDTADYSQIHVSADQISGKKDFLIEGNEMDLIMHKESVLDIELPAQVKMKVTKAQPGVKGDTVSGSTKKVEVETGLKIDVPLFVNEGESVMVDTRTREYVSRAET